VTTLKRGSKPMNVAAFSSAAMTPRVPLTAQAKATDERTESTATRVREADTGKEAAAPTQSANKVDMKV
jgi:hypothetical protein